MKIEPFFSPRELMTSYLITDDYSRKAIFINLSEVTMHMVQRLKAIPLYTILISDTRPSVISNIKMLSRIFPFSFYDFHGQSIFRACDVDIEKIDIPGRSSPIFRINGYLFTGNADISEMTDRLDPALMILPSIGPIDTVGNARRLRALRQEHSIRSQIG